MGTANTSETLARAQLYRFFARAFVYPDGDVLQSVRGLGAEVDAALAVLGGPAALLDSGKRLLSMLPKVTEAQLRDDYSALFTGREQCPLNEGDYDQSPFSISHRLADVMGFYRAFGLEPTGHSGERADFIGAEAEFLYVLLLKRLHAEEQAMSGEAELCRDAEVKFLRDHVVWWVPRLCQRLQQADPTGFYGMVACFMEAFVQREAARCVVLERGTP